MSKHLLDDMNDRLDRAITELGDKITEYRERADGSTGWDRDDILDEVERLRHKQNGLRLVKDWMRSYDGTEGMEHIDIVFDGPPGPESGRFVETEDADGSGVGVGEWIERADGRWSLRIAVPSDSVRRDTSS